MSLLFLKYTSNTSCDSIVSQFLSRIPRSTSSIDVVLTDHITHSHDLNVILSTIYQSLRSKSTELGWDYTLQIQVLFNQDPKDFLLSKYTDVFSCLGYYQENVKQLMDVGSGKEDTSGLLDDASLGFAFGSLLVVAVGGTFDHLHDGHKILLSMASFVAKSKLIIGVTGPELLTKKKFSEVLESYSDREASVRVFLRRVNSPRISVDCYEMKDVCGPTGYVKEIDGLVVSAETAKGAEFVNKFRSDKNWPTLQVITIKVVGDNDNADESFKGKLSSSDIREREYKKKYGH